MTLIKFENVVKTYTGSGNSAVSPLLDISLDIKKGARVALLGKSGSGKSTFLNLAGGVDSPTSGRIYFQGKDLAEAGDKALARYRRKEVGFIFQSFNLFPTLTVLENVMLPLEMLGIFDDRPAYEILASVGLKTQEHKYPEHLSGGEQQRTAIARALVKEPSVILADEPTGNLDFETGNTILDLIEKTCKEHNATLIMATHSMEALWISDSRYRLKLGRLSEDPVVAE